MTFLKSRLSIYSGKLVMSFLVPIALMLSGCGVWNSATPDSTPPIILSTVPASGATNANINNAITVTFSEVMDTATITTATFTLLNGTLPVSGAVTYSDTTATFTPPAPLSPNTLYTATISTGVKDLAGNQLVSNYNWSFTTVNLLFMNYISLPIGSRPEAVAISDVNGDGRNDVVMTTSTNSGFFDFQTDYRLFVFFQNATGGLGGVAQYETLSDFYCRATTVAVGDINNDGKNDVAVGNSCGYIDVFNQTSAGFLTRSSEYYGQGYSGKIRIADMNNDGLLDVVGTGSTATGGAVSIWFQNAANPMIVPVVYVLSSPGDLDIGDVNNDGMTDIVVMSSQLYAYANLGILTQIPGGTFSAPAYYSVAANTLTSGVAVGDVTGDNLNDIVVTYGGNSPDSKVGVFPQNALGTLDPVVNYTSYGIPETVEIADVTGDGRKDVIVLHGGGNAMGVYQQLANGTLQAEDLYTIPYVSHYNSHGLAVGDINGDGKNDAVIADYRINDYDSGLVVLYHY